MYYALQGLQFFFDKALLQRGVINCFRYRGNEEKLLPIFLVVVSLYKPLLFYFSQLLLAV